MHAPTPPLARDAENATSHEDATADAVIEAVANLETKTNERLEALDRSVDVRLVRAVDRERVVRLGLSTRALLLVVLVVGVHGVGLGQRGRHQERTDHV